MPKGKRGKGKGRKGRKGKGKKKGGSKGVAPAMKTKHSTTKIKNLIVASETDVWLQETVNGQMVSTGNAGTAEHFYLNSIVHTSPSVATTIKGETFWSQAYQYYRIPQVDIVIRYCNTEAFPIDIVLYISNIDPGTTYSNYINIFGNPMTYSFQLDPKGMTGGARTFKIKGLQLSEILGSGTVETDDTFRATITADPTDLLWIGHAAICTGSNVFTSGNGVYYRKTVRRFTRFYSRAGQSDYFKRTIQPGQKGLRPFTDQSKEREIEEKKEAVKLLKENEFYVLNQMDEEEDSLEPSNSEKETPNGKNCNSSNLPGNEVTNWREAYLKGHVKNPEEAEEVQELLLKIADLQLQVNRKMKS
jgi:hypothetical protein